MKLFKVANFSSLEFRNDFEKYLQKMPAGKSEEIMEFCQSRKVRTLKTFLFAIAKINLRNAGLAKI